MQKLPDLSICMFVMQFILMDEPTSGMDPGSRSQVREIIKEVVRGGQSVLMTSHSMAECDALCDRWVSVSEMSLQSMSDMSALKGWQS